ncbi:MAG: RNB domain-containing ribonuclease [Alphaproteobacteria bacterium]|nr:RNB domain-containing ribonuclease [Alphaproteobacteria bacterium]
MTKGRGNLPTKPPKSGSKKPSSKPSNKPSRAARQALRAKTVTKTINRPPAQISTADALAAIAQDDQWLDKPEVRKALKLKRWQEKKLRDPEAAEQDEGWLNAMPSSLVTLEVVEESDDGDLYGLADDPAWKNLGRLLLPPNRLPLAVGQRVLTRLHRQEDGSVLVRLIRILPTITTETVVGVFERHHDGGLVWSINRRQAIPVKLDRQCVLEHKLGDGWLLKVAITAAPNRRLGWIPGKLLAVLGDTEAANNISLLAIHQHDIPVDFPADALAQAQAATAPTLPKNAKLRQDLRHIPLVTIDGEDARDYDDAVWAQEDDDPANPGGFKVMVAIADVAHYVPAESPLDVAARARGNSVYFPDRVVPMLPEALSNQWCSLLPNQARACLAVEITLDQHGQKIGHRFVRGLMQSVARLTYNKVQQLLDVLAQEQETGKGSAAKSAKTAAKAKESAAITDSDRPLAASVQTDLSEAELLQLVTPLSAVFDRLLRLRAKRGTLNIELPEYKVRFDAAGQISAIAQTTSMASHKLIEELMVMANVCAAETIQDAKLNLLYRIHDRPDPMKIEHLQQVLREMEISLGHADGLTQHSLNQALAAVAGTAAAPMVNELVLRSQSQAVYSPTNIGHFGLNLANYAHFTSPIRRYSDLLVHRMLLHAIGLGEAGIDDGHKWPLARWEEVGQHLSITERRAAAAERDAFRRYAIAYLAAQGQQLVEGRVNGVTRAGLFISIAAYGAEGFMPISLLPRGYWRFDAARQCLTQGSGTGASILGLGDTLLCRIEEIDMLTGNLILSWHYRNQPPGREDEVTRPQRPTAAGEDESRGRKTSSRHQRAKDRARVAGSSRKKRAPHSPTGRGI